MDYKECGGGKMNYYTREQAIGYLIIAARMLGLNEKEIKDLVYKMEDEMDAWTKETAEQTYDKFYGREF